MRPQDKTVFLEAARLFQSWILVRQTNPASLKYIGLRGYTPKPIDCKAKTADRDVSPYKLAGLVVDPGIHASAFDAAKVKKARDFWATMEPVLGKKYLVDNDKNSRHYGCLMLEGRYIHGDYDLYAVVDIAQPHRHLALVTTLEGQLHMRGPRFYALQSFLNKCMGSDMVQHGSEEDYAHHSEQKLDAFGPNGEDEVIPDEFTLRNKWYKEKFQGRKTLKESWIAG